MKVIPRYDTSFLMRMDTFPGNSDLLSVRAVEGRIFME